jgi:ketosteroid isomerase-like protein
VGSDIGHLEIIRRTVEAWDRGDPGSLITFFDDEAVWFALPGNPDYPDPVRGRQAILRLIEEWLEPWDRYEIETLEVVEHGDAAIWTARHIASEDRTGMRLDVSMSAVFDFRDDRIVQARFFLHRGEALAAAGAE